MLFDLTAWWPALVFYGLFVYWIRDARLYSSLGFSRGNVVAIFTVKLLWCFAFAAFHWLWFHGGDTYTVFAESAQVNRALHRDWRDFAALEFLPNRWYVLDSLYHYDPALRMYGNESTWLMVRLNALFYLVSFGSYPAHVVMFAFATLPASLCLLRFMAVHTTVDPRWWYAALLVFPGVAFWCNGMHKEAMLVSGAGFAFYALTKARDKGWSATVVGLLSLGVVLMLSRAYMPLLLAPGMLAVYFYARPVSARAKAITVTGIGLVVAVALVRLTRNDFWNGILVKQHAFAKLTDPNATRAVLRWSDMPHFLAAAFYHGFVSPVPFLDNFDIKDLPLLFSNALLLALPLLTFRYFDRRRFIKLGMWFVWPALLYFLIIGFMVPQAGAVSRYKAPMVLFLIFGWICSLKPIGLLKLKSKQFLRN